MGSRITYSGQKFRQFPDVIGQSRLHRGRHAQAAMHAAEVVVGEVKALLPRRKPGFSFLRIDCIAQLAAGGLKDAVVH
jgi:hypothetical protein